MKIPDKVLSQHIAILGRTGSGKTYTAKGLVERLISEGRRVCVLDPTDAWWGLRSGPDGTSSGLPVVIFGGDHADVPITEHAGTAMGELIANSDFPSIISLANTTLGERHRFVERFAESLFRVNKRPLYLVIDEADEFAPQSGPPGTERMLGAIDRIVRRGRIKGFRVMMITQRPAVLNKNVLTQANTLIAMRLPSSQDRAAVEAWVKGQADESQAKDMMKSLASLQRGEGWVWAPEQNVLERVKFPAIATFDSSRTPDDGEPIRDVHVMRAVDVAGITKAMAAAIEEAKGSDPEELRKQIKELRKQLTDERVKPIDVHAGDIGKLQDEIAELRHINQEHEKYMQVMADRGDFILSEAERVAQMLMELPRSSLQKFPRPPLNPYTTREASESRATQAPERPPTKALDASSVPAVAPAPQHDRHARGAGNGAKELQGDLPKATLKVWGAAAFFEAIGVVPTRQQVAFLAKIKPTTGTFSNYIGALRSAGIIDYPGQGLISVTDKGLEFPLGHVPKNRSQLLDYFQAELNGQHRAIFAVLREAATEMTREDLGKAIGVTSSSGTFSNYIGFLRGVGLIEYPSSGMVKLATWLIKWSPKARSA